MNQPGPNLASPPPIPQHAAFLAYQLAHKDETRQPNLIAAVCVCAFLAYLAVFLRVLSRRIHKQPLQADDWWIVASLILVTLWDVFMSWLIHVGLGLHIIRLTDANGFVQSAVGGMILYNLCIPPIKFSILHLYHRIFPAKSIKFVGIGIAAVVTGAALASAIALGLLCRPLSSMWTNQGGVGDNCIDLSALAMATGIINILTDVAILCLPIRPLLGLKAPMLVRAGLIGTFLLGGCVCIASIIRTIIVGHSPLEDTSWNLGPGAIWTVIEIHVGIVSACLPVLRPLFIKRNTHSSPGSNRTPNGPGYPEFSDSAAKKSKKNPYSFTNGSLWRDEDAIPLQDTPKKVHGAQWISKQTQINISTTSAEQV
ncbi:hypothetical protein BCR34DRAFT_600651 [Clohesyomyces aquaticus]|uniref:Rhodopsin domain-containing protein n=1 Tax=Clohesyomyces aquaticus TaxID=1231657 RepID=A0A1Y1ZQD2_9PLEO|nr:hypothetical protein BCR34DRAFT_600651 [Clohesyomyces aquaticus]